MKASYYTLPSESIISLLSVGTAEDLREKTRKQMEEDRKKGRWIKDSEGRFRFIQFPEERD